MADHTNHKVKSPKPTGRTCDIEGCHRALFSKGMCGLHYQRNRRHGDPNAFRKFEYPRKDIDNAMALYGQGKPVREITAETGIPAPYLKILASQRKIHRKPEHARKNMSDAQIVRWARERGLQKS